MWPIALQGQPLDRPDPERHFRAVSQTVEVNSAAFRIVEPISLEHATTPLVYGAQNWRFPARGPLQPGEAFPVPRHRKNCHLSTASPADNSGLIAHGSHSPDVLLDGFAINRS